MTRQRWLVTLIATICLMGVLLPVGAVWANPIGGSATMSFDNGGTLSGDFVFNPAGNGFVSWNLTSTAFSSTHVYDSTNTTDGPAAAIFTSSQILNSNQEAFFFSQNFGSAGLFELDIVVDCVNTTSCLNLGAPNTTFNIVAGPETCSGSGKPCISSGEGAVVGIGQHFLDTGVFNVTDPPANTLAFNIDSTIAPGFTPFAGAAASVPEPASIFFFGAAIIFLTLFMGQRKEATAKASSRPPGT